MLLIPGKERDNQQKDGVGKPHAQVGEEQRRIGEGGKKHHDEAKLAVRNGDARCFDTASLR